MSVIAILAGLAPILVALLSLSGLISAAETSMTAASRGRMHQLEREGDRAARRINIMMADQEKMIGAILLSNNVINIGASALTTLALSAAFPGALGALIATGIMTVLIVIFSEILPKSLAIARADDVARALSIPTYWVVRIFGPLANGAQWVVRQTLRPFGIKLSMETDVLAAHEEIRGAVEYHHSEGLVEERDRRMLGGVLDLSDMDVSEVMVHRMSISMIDADLSPAEVVTAMLESAHTRVPLYRGDAENIVGVLHAKDLLQALANSGGKIDKLAIDDILREPWFIPDTTNLKDQLNAFLKRQSHFALVVDEYGALQGLVTLEDILEEIVGEIDDEHDSAIQGVRKQADGSVVVDGSVTIRDLNRAMDWDMPDDDAVTVAGLVIHEAQTIPKIGQTFIFHRHRFQVVKRVRNQITTLRVSAPLDANTSASEA
ncbi:MAG: HlyC/CorC family transporter [Phenylobacterium sp.]|uniref:HlyC/CorC family transporter n=1 Tax=Phenylobacterium ferrooxidans TaxID=2982689 RepID=A0ABW6CI91_9CAUL|nr:HlyC/CorC family transporter [Phenylobacterium sp.]MDO8910343.1 HlyC/CorC family transporter [Phenylobacterium sp.]MDO9245944.1 HlyC/CorC family transporter [Phenylobacterium sp.]MDP2010343.1 HlyC/CorC family transporter [Phenylobacterium sp.]MDP3099737.1 HlyC/CorC family transporter [Phenylobacterium sp.]MDP3635459.1 HlyC/CorC family transporter [Phenylobacterium sp.]